MKRTILCVIVLAAMFSVAEATPFQTIGMLRTPDAYVLPHKAAEILVAGYYRDIAKPDYYNTDEFGKFVPYGMLGIGLFDRVELGLFGGDSVFYLNLKVKIIEETNKIPQLSVGMDNIFSPVNRRRTQDHTPTTAPDWDYADHPDKHSYEYYSPYIVGSKQVVFGGINWMFNLGVGTNRYIGWDQRARIWNGLFYSVEMTPLKNLALQGEFSGHEFNAGIKYTYKNFGLKVGIEALEDFVKDNGYEENLRVAVGLSYLFDKYSEGKQVRPNLSEYAAAVVTGDEFVVIDIPDEIAEGPDVTPPGGDVIPPGGDVIPPGGDVIPPGDDVIPPGDDVIPPGDDVTPPGGDVIPPGGDVTPPGDDVTPPAGDVTPPDDVLSAGTDLALTPPSDTLTSPGVVVQSSTYKELSPEVKDLLAELKNLREQRQKAQKALEDLRKWLQEQKK
jgi:hypothetical protein